VIDFLTQPPQHDLHALYLDDSARERLFDEMVNSFGRGVWPDQSRGNTITLKVSEEGVLPSAEERLSHKKMASYRSIETEGDGMKSYVATCVALLLGRRPVCLIDEPEMCLHPPQAYNLGRFIGRFGSGDTATFVATHSSHVLRGIIQTAADVQIIRLTRRKNFFAHLVPATVLTEALSRPAVRAEAVLDGIFAQSVIVVEADSDRVVYQAAWETLNDKFRMDAHFTTVGGTGGIADTCRLYRTLRIPIAVIADLDMLMDPDRMGRVLRELVGEKTSEETLLRDAQDVAEKIRSLPPPMTPDDLRRDLARLNIPASDWSQNDDIVLRRSLKQLANNLDRMRRLKNGGAAQYPEEIAMLLRALLSSLQKVGLFLVPVGELEEWLADKSLDCSKTNKWAWANAAAQKIYEVGQSTGDIWDVVSAVGEYLVSAAGQSAPTESSSHGD